MKVLVYDVAAEEGGALTILNNFYHMALDEYPEIEWKFMVSLPKLESRDNVTVVNYPEVKNGWIARLKFDKLAVPKLIKEYNPDYVLNLQNVYVKSKCPQILYMHQSLPFIDHKFSIRETKMWVYQNVIGRMIKKSCRTVDKIIVQTNWIKDAVIKQCKVKENKIIISPPKVDLSKIIANTIGFTNQFFYPAGASVYKNHSVIVSACEGLTKAGIDYSVTFTLKGDESDYIKGLKELSESGGLNINWVGNLSIEEVYEYYSRSTLIFPSYIETFGLPLLEARQSGARIIASDTSFAREVCDGYDKVQFFEIFDNIMLAKIMQEHCEK